MKKVVQPDRPHMKIACRITNATITHSEYVTAYVVLFHSKNSYASAPQCYIIGTLSVLLETYSSLDGQDVLHALRHTSVHCCVRQVRHSQWFRTKATELHYGDIMFEPEQKT